MPDILRFGIESLDKLVGGSSEDGSGMNIPRNKDGGVLTTSLCLIGPDGTGKSVLALHLAAQYLADCIVTREKSPDEALPKVLYISTDLTHSMAKTIWNNFDLGHPHMRKEPFATRGRKKKRTPLFDVNDLKDPKSLIAKLLKSNDPLSEFLRTQFTGNTQALLENYDGSTLPSGLDGGALQRVLIDELNNCLKGSALYDQQRFKDMKLSEEARGLIGEKPKDEELIRLNRLLLEEAYPDEIAQRHYCLELVEMWPNAVNRVLAENKDNGNEVGFVDLAQATAGDDWGFVHRMLSILDLPENKKAPRHLVLLDAVEGFETLVGDLNAFGEKSTRRSRIAQVMRLAAKKSHLLFVVEEAKQERLPEEFVTDAVIRLRNIEINGYVRRTVEIEKTRGQAHVRGQHPFVTRDGKGSTTGDATSVNHDDPEVGLPPDKYQSYVHVFPSINYLSRAVMETQGKPRMEAPRGKYAGFGIPYLDTMLGDDDEPKTQTDFDQRGLPCGSVTALIGDALTQKSQLGRAFLSRTFYPIAKALADKVRRANLRLDTGESIDDFKLRVTAELDKAIEGLRRAALWIDLDGDTTVAHLFSGSSLFGANNLKDPKSLIAKLLKSNDPLSEFLRTRLSADTRRLLKKYDRTNQWPESLQKALIDELNRWLKGPCLYDEQRFKDLELSDEARELIAQGPKGEGLIRLNRLLLEEAYPDEIFATVDDFRDAQSLIEKLQDKEHKVSLHLRKEFSEELLALIDGHDAKTQPGGKLLGDLKRRLNELLANASLYDPVAFADVALSEATSAQLKRLAEDGGEPTKAEIVRRNRMLLEDAYLQELAVEKAPGVAVLMTTQDTHSTELAKEFMLWLNPGSMLGENVHKDVVESFEQILQAYIKEHTICRRMEIHDLSAPLIAHIFQRNIEAAQRKLFNKSKDDELPEVNARFRGSWRIRMVVDDFNAFRNTFPDIHNDPLLLPFLLFHLRREGISTLILDTQSGKPDIALAERFESSLREVTDYRLYTWRIPFYGETRIAITAIPPLSPKTRGLIRELRKQWVDSDADTVDRNLTVDPHFELYAGLERGTPHPVPLEVRLFPGTEKLIKYIEDENVFFREIFTPNTGKSDIIVGFNPPRYEAFREFCYLQRDTRLDYTLVFQVDEFWLTWLTRQSRTRKAGVLQRLWPYLDAVTVEKNGEPARAADAYYLFQKTFEQSRQTGTVGPQPQEEYRRRAFYDNDRLGYGFNDGEITQQSEVDRVPFLWDFAFLLCKENLWEEYIDNKDLHEDSKKEKVCNVKRVWEQLPRAKPARLFVSDFIDASGFVSKLKDEQGGVLEYLRGKFDDGIRQLLDQYTPGQTPSDNLLSVLVYELNKLLDDPSLYEKIPPAQLSDRAKKLFEQSPTGESLVRFNLFLLKDAYPNEIAKNHNVSWRQFFQACKEVADYQSAKLSAPVPAFDFSLNDGEAFSCLVLEIWLSEIYEMMQASDKKRTEQQTDEKKEEAAKLAHLLSHKIWDRWEVDTRIGLLGGLKGDEDYNSLAEILEARSKGEVKGYSLELYKTWLLLTEVIDFSELISTPRSLSFEFKSRQSNPEAVAAHHWYQSACDLIDQHHLAENLVAVRLPGHFSVRGDWFLAAAGGSRSSLLAHRAMDLLSSRRANIKRLQLGIGLPVRTFVVKEQDFEHVRTRLISTDDKTGRLKNVSYEEFLSIAGRTRAKVEDVVEQRNEFYWLWRSSLYGYARCSKVWQKWLNRMALWWQTLHARHVSDWTPGFTVYKEINDYLDNTGTMKLEDFDKYESWKHFHAMVKILLMELQQVSFGNDREDED